MNIMKNSILKKIIFFSLIISTFFACSSRKEVVYFQGESEVSKVFENFSPTIQSSDNLAISVSAANLKATEIFNQNSIYKGTTQTASPFISTYTVDKDGYIQFPVLGNVKLGGLTKNEAIELLKTQISTYIKDPGIVLNLTNFKITVLGEVKAPGTFPIQNDRITILEALGMAGDLTIKGVRNNVMVIREKDGQKETHYVDLTSKESLNSPVYYLAQNDVVYIEPNSSQISASKFTPNYSLWMSLAGIIISVISVITR